MTRHSIKEARERCGRIRLGTLAGGFASDATAIAVLLADNARLRSELKYLSGGTSWALSDTIDLPDPEQSK